MREHSLPSGIQLENQHVPFGDIHQVFSQTAYGTTLEENMRFSQFKPENITNQTWEKILGVDVNNLKHLKLTYHLTQQFLKHCETPDATWQGHIPPEARFSQEEQQMLLVTAMTHDWAEAIVGDIPFIYKKESDHNEEMLHLKNIFHEVLGNGNNSIDCERLTYDVQSILTDPQSKLGKAFNAIERMGYMRTGLRAWESSHTENTELGRNLRRLATDVVPRHTAVLASYAEIYPPVSAYLHHNRERISIVFEAAEHDGVGHLIPFHGNFSKAQQT